MRIQIDIEEMIDDGGTASYRAWWSDQFNSSWHETKWEAVEELAEMLARYEDANEAEVE